MFLRLELNDIKTKNAKKLFDFEVLVVLLDGSTRIPIIIGHLFIWPDLSDLTEAPRLVVASKLHLIIL
jgi:hypothetical protein